MTYDTATAPQPRVQAGSRSSGRHRQAKAQRSMAGAAAFRAAAVEITAPNDLAAMAGIIKPRLP
jgi:hypothetical protein